MIYPCARCDKPGKDAGTCKCLDWKRWFMVEFDKATGRDKPKEEAPTAPPMTHREIVCNTIFTRLWR